MYRLMQPSDKAAVLALWQRERGESEEFAANAVERFAGQQNVYVAEENDAIAAVALAVPVTLQGRQGSYLYGLCGQGSLILAGLLDYLCAQQKLRGAGFTVAVPATPEQAGEVCGAIRSILRKLYGARIARSTTIQYGGSMNEANAEALLAQEDVDGGLIGGASLDPDKFLQIIHTANQD